MLAQIIRETSTNGRWGIAIVGPEGTDMSTPQRGALTCLGDIEGVETYRFDPAPDAPWIVVTGEVEPLAGCKVITSMDLQSSNCVSIVAGGEFFAYNSYGYKRRSSHIHCFRDGQAVDVPATVLAAMGILPAEVTPVDTTPPELGGPLQAALRKAGLT